MVIEGTKTLGEALDLEKGCLAVVHATNSDHHGAKCNNLNEEKDEQQTEQQNKKQTEQQNEQQNEKQHKKKKMVVVKKICSCLNVGVLKKLHETAMSDPRRMVHAIKVGMALSIASIIVMAEIPHWSLGLGSENAVWALITVAVVFEFTVGATLSKGLNRGIGTMLAGLAALGVDYLAGLTGDVSKRIIICLAVFFFGIAGTFIRFVPKIKAKYEYGVLVFILTFSFIAVSGHSEPNTSPVMRRAVARLFTILAGCSVCLIMCTFIIPIWAGDEFHELIADNFDKLADSLEGCINSYVNVATKNICKDKNGVVDDPTYKSYQSVVTSNQQEDSLANFASWEPPHGRFKLVKYPWKSYLKVGAALRHCAYTSMALQGCICSESQAPQELRQILKKEILAVGKGVAKVLHELGDNIRHFHQSRPIDELMKELDTSAEELQDAIHRHSYIFLNPEVWLLDDDLKVPSSTELSIRASSMDHRRAPSQIFISRANSYSLVTFATLLVEVVARLQYVVEAVTQLTTLAKFKKPPFMKAEIYDEEKLNVKSDSKK